jgi:hypothetical protein
LVSELWTISGYVEYTDGTPGYKTEILLRDAPSNPQYDTYGLISSVYADNKGRYIFNLTYLSDLLERSMAGTYYLNVVTNNTYSSKPDIIVTVEQDQSIEIEDTLVARKDLDISLPLTRTAKKPGCYIAVRQSLLALTLYPLGRKFQMRLCMKSRLGQPTRIELRRTEATTRPDASMAQK